MAHFEKVRTGHKRWRAQLPALAGGTTVRQGKPLVKEIFALQTKRSAQKNAC